MNTEFDCSDDIENITLAEKKGKTTEAQRTQRATERSGYSS